MSSTADTKISPITQTLAAYIAAAPRKALPKAVTEKTKHHILDTLAAMVSGSKLPPGKAALAYAKTLGGTKEATVVGSRMQSTAVNAALANAMMAHADETDDSHAPSMMHPGCYRRQRTGVRRTLPHQRHRDAARGGAGLRRGRATQHFTG